ncbi:hypothetical protein NEOLI_001427, partial [Neolecta irregularis DAH-3]
CEHINPPTCPLSSYLSLTAIILLFVHLLFLAPLYMLSMNLILLSILFITSTTCLTWSGYSPRQNATYPLGFPISVSVGLANVSNHDIVLAYNINNGSIFTVWDTNSTIVSSSWWNSTIYFNKTGLQSLDFFFLEICEDDDDIKTPAQHVSFFVKNQTNATNVTVPGGRNTSEETVWKIDVENVYRQKKCKPNSSSQSKEIVLMGWKNILGLLAVVTLVF